MTVTCPTCKTNLTIPDERLPKGKVVTAACPRCKGSIVIDTSGAAPPPAGPAAPAQPAPAPPAEEPAEFGERGQPRALVCVAAPGERDLVVAALRQQGYAATVVSTTAEATERLRFTAYAVVVLRDGFGSGGGGGNPVLDQIAEMATATRRHIHVVFVSPAVRSHDSSAALARSVNLVLHPNDLPHLAEDLKRSLAETEQKYRVLLESLRAMGRG